MLKTPAPVARRRSTVQVKTLAVHMLHNVFVAAPQITGPIVANNRSAVLQCMFHAENCSQDVTRVTTLLIEFLDFVKKSLNQQCGL